MSVWYSVRPRRRLVAIMSAVVAAVSLAVPALTETGQAAVPHPSARAQAMGVHTAYAVQRPVCAAPVKAGEFTCMSYRSVDVPAGTPGARKYSIPMWARGPAGGLTPKALAAAYYFDPSVRTSKTVAIVDWYNAPNIRKDLAAYDKHFGLPAETASSFRIVNENGNAAPLPKADPDSSVEISLDVQAVRAVCNHCKILLVEASAPQSSNLAHAENTAVRLGADVISNSFGAPEHRGHPFPASIYKAFNHKGVVITASSGDNGWYFWDIANESPFDFASSSPQSASFPASMSTVVSVGGTKLTLAANGKRASETVWNGNGANDVDGNSRGAALGASGGGCSVQFAAPSWQLGLAGYQQAGCAKKRLSVDVSAVGDPATGLSVYDSYGLGGWGRIGGTSLSSPVIAAMWALAGGARGMAYPGRALYQNYVHRKGAVYDVTAGGSSWCGGTSTASCAKASDDLTGTTNPNSAYGGWVDCSFPKTGRVTKIPARNAECNAVTGYDGPSGVGSPRNLHIFQTTAPSLSLTSSVHPKGQPTRFWMKATRPIDSTRIVERAWAFGDGTGRKVTASGTTTHVYKRAGTYTVHASVTDNLGQTATATKVVRIP